VGDVEGGKLAGLHERVTALKWCIMGAVRIKKRGWERAMHIGW